MALVIRMRQQGKNGRQHFRVVLTNSRSPRDGKYVEKLGWYDPFGEGEKSYHLDIPRIEHWLGLGAEISDRVKALVKRANPETVRKIVEKKVAKVAKERKRKKASAKK